MDQDLIASRPMNAVSDFYSQVDIIIPYHGQYQKLTNLLDSVFRLTRSNYYQVCVVDDHSPNAEFIKVLNKNAQKVAKMRNTRNVFQAVRCTEQRGWGGACLAGYKATESPYVCFLNSDCLIEDSGWLKCMGEALLKLKEQDVRMVAPMTNNSVGGHPAQTGGRYDRSDEHVILGESEYLSLYCIMCHRELFPRCGGFFKEYPYGFYEDQEFAARMQHYGFKQAVCKTSWVKHEGGCTVEELWRQKPETRQIMEEENRAKCIADIKKLG